jgi:hypothetical protein
VLVSFVVEEAKIFKGKEQRDSSAKNAPRNDSAFGFPLTFGATTFLTFHLLAERRWPSDTTNCGGE